MVVDSSAEGNSRTRMSFPAVGVGDAVGGRQLEGPGALTGANDRAEALELAPDALSVMLAGFVKDRKGISVPSPVLDGQEIVTVDPVTDAQLALYSAMR